MEKVLVFQRIFFEFQVSKTFNISKDCQIKACKSLKQEIFLEPLEEHMLFLLVLK